MLLSVFFAGISGSSTADAASQSKIFIEAQTKEGYDLSFSIAITAVSAVLAVIIPPSILMIVWGGVLSVSIGALYLAGILPGLLIAARADGDRARLCQALQLSGLSARDACGEFLCSAAQSVPALMTPFIIVGGILLGWFTATESACVAVIYAARAVDLHLSRDGPASSSTMRWLETGRLSAVALFCVGTASAFGWLLAYYQIPRALLANVTHVGHGHHRGRLLHRLRVPGGGLLPRRDPGDHHRRHHAASRWRGRWTCIRCSSPSSASLRLPSGW